MRAEHYIQKAFISPFLSKLDRCYHKCSNQTNHAAIFLFRINHHRSLRCGLFVLVIVHYFHPYDYLAVAAYKTVPFSFSRQSNRCCEGIQFDGCDAVKSLSLFQCNWYLKSALQMIYCCKDDVGPNIYLISQHVHSYDVWIDTVHFAHIVCMSTNFTIHYCYLDRFVRWFGNR
jgi:hypothetical protein